VKPPGVKKTPGISLWNCRKEKDKKRKKIIVSVFWCA